MAFRVSREALFIGSIRSSEGDLVVDCPSDSGIYIEAGKYRASRGPSQAHSQPLSSERSPVQSA